MILLNREFIVQDFVDLKILEIGGKYFIFFPDLNLFITIRYKKNRNLCLKINGKTVSILGVSFKLLRTDFSNDEVVVLLENDGKRKNAYLKYKNIGEELLLERVYIPQFG